MNWIVDQLPEQSLLNTSGWKYIMPQLYRHYPNDNMRLNISVSSPPIIEVSNKGINATIHADLVIEVVDSGEVIKVACISLVSPHISNALPFLFVNHILLMIEYCKSYSWKCMVDDDADG